MSWRAQVLGSLLIAAVLVIVAAGLARPVGQRCAEADSLADHQLRDEAIAAYQGLLKATAPTCAALGLQRELALGVTTTVATSHPPETASQTTVPVVTAVTTITRPPAPPGTVRDLHRNLPGQLSGVSTVREWVADLGLSLIGWVLVGLAALLVFRSIWSAIASGRAGSINLGAVTDGGPSPSGAGPAQASDPAVMAQLKDRLAGQELFGSAALPNGTVTNVGGNELVAALASAVKAADNPASGVAALLSFLPSLIPQTGLTIDVIMRVGELDPRSGCTITLTDQAKGKVAALHTHWARTPLLAVDGAVLFAIAYIGDMSRFRKRTPVWSRFGTHNESALVAYVHGEDCERAGKLDEALVAYQRAMDCDPGNLTVGMKVASTHELLAAKAEAAGQLSTSGSHLTEAVSGYQRASQLWPEAFAPRYRLALALGQLSATNHTVPSRRDDAENILIALQADLSFRRLFRKWARTFLVPRHRREGTRAYFGRLLVPRRRSSLRAAYRISALVVSDKTADKVVEGLVAPGAGRSQPDWQVKYNAACYYARRGQWSKANGLIAEVLRDPYSQLTRTWLKSDPDLAGLRAWKGEIGDVNVIPDSPVPAPVA